MPFGQELNILNQRQTPAWFADTFANRPSFGFAGRMFISTDTQEIWRDTGTGWILIAAAGIGAITASNGVTISGNDVRLGGSLTGNTTISGNFGITLSQGFLRTNFITANPTDGVTGGGFAQTITPTADVTGVTNVYGGVDILTINLASAKITTPSATNISAGLSSLVLQNSNGQSTGVIAAHRAALTSVNNVNAADVRLYNAKTPEYSGAGASIANLYGIYIEAQKSAAVTNAWGIYQAGATDFNYLNGDTAIGTTSFGTATKLTIGGSETAASAIARGGLLNTTLVASANNDVLVGLDINPTFTNGAFTGVKNLSIRATNADISGFIIGTDAVNGNINFITKNIATSVALANSSTAGNASLWAGTNASPISRVMANGNGTIYLLPTLGVLINTTTDAGFKLDVNGTARVQDQLTLRTTDGTGLNLFNGAITFTAAGGGRLMNVVNTNISYNSAYSFGITSSGGNSTWFSSNQLGISGTGASNTTLDIIRSSNYLTTIIKNINSLDASSFLDITTNSYSSNDYGAVNGGSVRIFPGDFTSTSGGTFGNIILGHNGTTKRGNVLIGTSTNVPSAIVNISSTTQGFLPPRMTTTERDAITSPAAGLIIYNTTTNKHQGYNGTTWNDFY